MSPNQEKNFKVSIEDLLKKADETPVSKGPRKAVDLISVVQKLRDEKKFTWDEIQEWMRMNTEFNHSTAHWINLYKKHGVNPANIKSK